MVHNNLSFKKLLWFLPGMGIMLGACLSLFSCGVSGAIDATQAVPPKLDSMLQKLQATQDAIHKQTLDDAEKEMMKPENTAYLNPPLRMMIPGQIFANEATADDLIKFTFIKLKDIQELKPDDSLKTANGKFPPDLIKQFDDQKVVLLSVLSVILGLAPQSTILDMVNRVEHQLHDGNRYFSTLYSALYLRASFIQLTCLEADIFEEGLKYPGSYYDAIDYINSIEYITALPFKNKISINITGMLDPNYNFQQGLDANMTKPLWQRLDRGLRDELDPDWASYAPPIKKIIAPHLQGIPAHG